MIGLKHLLRLAEVVADAGTLLPRHVYQPVDVVADHGGLGRHRRHHLELAELGGGLGARLLRHPRRLDPLGEIVEIVRRLVVSELFLDRLHLLVEVVLALALLHLPLHTAANPLLDLQEVDLLLDARDEVRQPFPRVVDLEDCLPLVDLHREMGGDGIGETRRVVDVRQGGEDFRRYLLVELDVLLEVGEQGTGQRLDLALVFAHRLKQGDARAEE